MPHVSDMIRKLDAETDVLQLHRNVKRIEKYNYEYSLDYDDKGVYFLISVALRTAERDEAVRDAIARSEAYERLMDVIKDITTYGLDEDDLVLEEAING